MNIQIFGTTKCFDTKKAQRYFKERGIRFQMIDLKEKEMSRGEFENVSRALGGWQALVDPNAKDKQTLALLDARVDFICLHQQSQRQTAIGTRELQMRCIRISVS